MKKVISIVLIGLVSILIVGCGPQKLTLQPNMQQVMDMSKKDAVSYLSSLNGKRCTSFNEDYITITQWDESVSKEYSKIIFNASKEGSEYRIYLGIRSGKYLFICTPYQGSNLREAQETINALDKLGTLIQ